MNERFVRAGKIARIALAHERDFALGPVRVRPAFREIVADDCRETTEPRVMRVLVALFRAQGDILSRDDLIECCWDGVIVGEDAINRCIGRLRKVAEASGGVFAVETVPRVGYRLRIPEFSKFKAASAPAQHRVVYRGLQSLNEQDSAIFFGRDAPIAQALDVLRRMRDGSPKSMLVILGASGAGKSSFLKAGLLARLKLDEENFLVLPVIRPERAALTGSQGMAECLSSDPAELNGAGDLVKVFSRLREPIVERLRRVKCQSQDSALRLPTIVIPIDQTEELFSGEDTEAGRVLELLADAVRSDPDTIIVATIRSDAFERLQSEARVSDILLLPFSLAPPPHGAFKEVIEGPARLAEPKLAIEPALTEQLLRDLAARDALPLLAFTLERLWLRHRGGGTLTLAEYIDDLGGLQGAIKGAVELAFAKAQHDPALPPARFELERLARRTLIPSLVQLDNADSEPRRRVERLNALPETTLPLVRHLANQRLLVIDRCVIDGTDSDTVEIAHEAILRQWPALKSWIAEERDALRALDGVRSAAREWKMHRSSGDHGNSWLVHGKGRLEAVEQLMAPAHFAAALQPFERDYLLACRARDSADHEREKFEIEREKKSIARARRLQRNIFVAISAAVAVVLLAGFGIAELLKGIAMRSSDALAGLSEQATGNQDYERAARYALAGLAGADWPILGYSGARAERALRTADTLSRSLAVLRGHNDSVWNAAYSPDGTRIVTTSSDRTARIWNARTGTQVVVLRGHNAPVERTAYSPDGTRIVTASLDKTARIWDARTGAQIAVLRGHDGWVNSAAYSPDGAHIVTASSDKTARIWDARTGAQISVLRGHDGAIFSAAYGPDSTRIVTASVDKTARIWDAHTGTQLAVLRGNDGIVFIAAYSPDGSRVVTGSIDRTARIWDARTGAQIAVLRGHDGAIIGAAYSPDGARIVTASSDETVRIWDARAGTQIAVLRGHNAAVTGVAYSPDGARIVTASDDHTARIWVARTGTQIAVLRGHAGNVVFAAAFSPDKTHIVTASDDHTARIWDARTGTQLGVLRGHDGIVFTAAYSPDATHIVTASWDKTACIWDARTGTQFAVLHGHDDIVYRAAYSPDGAHIVTASSDKTARIWDARTGAQIAVLRGHDGWVNSAAYSPDGAHIVTASVDKTARIWDARTGTQLALLRGHDGPLVTAAYSPDGRHIVTASVDKTARIWDARTGAQIVVLRGHDDNVVTAAYSPDGKRIVTASWDKTARIWDARTGTQLAILFGHDEAVQSAAYSPDGAHIVTSSSDRTARIWKSPEIDASLLSLPRKSLVARTCAMLLSNGVDHFSTEELAAAPDLDPKLNSDACHSPTLWTRIRALLFEASASQ